MVHIILSLCYAAVFAYNVNARPLIERSTSLLSISQITEWTTPAQLASAAYCSPNSIQQWTCGPACANVTRPLTVVAGGDGGFTPRFFVAKLSSTTMVVAISGTNVSNTNSVLVDLDFPLVNIDATLFPSSTGAQVHQGFYNAFKKIQTVALPAVKIGVAAGVTEILITGHSLGGALTHLMATHLQKALGSSVSVTAKAFASPRVGNQAWANYVDTTLGASAIHMINFNDDVPHVPPRDWGFQQSSNEIWILADKKSYLSCSGQENPLCSDSLEAGLNSLLLVASFVDDFDTPEHLGPYAGVTITSEYRIN